MRKKKVITKVMAMLLSFAVVFSMMPGVVFAGNDNVNVNFTFDISSLGTAEVLEPLNVKQIPGIQVEVAKETTVKDALKKYVEENESGVSFTGIDNDFITEINEIPGYNRNNNQKFEELMESLCAEDTQGIFQSAGWMYFVDGQLGNGIGRDKITKDTTVNFRYTLYYVAKSTTEGTSYDWEFIDAYNALKEKIAAADAIVNGGYDGFSNQQKTMLDNKLQEAKDAVSKIDDEAFGVWAAYIASKGTSLWGTGSPTDKLQKAGDNLSDAINKMPTPESITYKIKKDGIVYDANNLPTLYVGDTVQIIPIVLPEGASQAVTYDSLLGKPVIDSSGNVTFTQAGLNMMQAISQKDTSKRATISITVKALPTYTATFEPADGLVFTEGSTLTVTKDEKSYTGKLNNGEFSVRELPNGEYTYTFTGDKVSETGTLIVNGDTTVKLSGRNAGAVSEELMNNISSSYVESSGEWVVMDMGAYAKYNPDTANKLSEKAKQQYINNAIASITGENVSDTTIDKAVLALRAIGADETRLYNINSNTPINAIEKLNAVTKSSSTWSAPYTLAAYNQGEYNSDEYENSLIADLLAAQQDDGSWNEGGTIDTTANAIAGLSFYKDREDVASAIDKAVAYLSSQQKTTGAYDGGYGENSNSTAMVIIGLAAAGINPDTDSRFIKNGNSLLDGLFSFAISDNTGFGYTDNSAKNDFSTEQSFRALIAAAQVMKTGKAYNVYDFSSNEVKPARATGSAVTETPAPPTGSDITVSVTVKSDTEYWLNNYPVTIPGEGATVYHAFTKACNYAGITYVGAESGYVSSMTKSGKTLAEFDKGENSGWMYKVNGTLPEVGLTSYSIKNGDDIVWFYTDDWTTVPGVNMGNQNKSQVTTSGSDTKTTTVPTEVKISGKTAAATVTDENAAELIKQAKENKSVEIVINVSSSDAKDAETVNLEFDKKTVESIVKDTEATVTVKTPAGEINLDKETLKQIAGEAEGNKISIEITKVSKPEEAQKSLVGANGQIFKLVVKSGNKMISKFKGTVTVRLAVPAALKDKNIAAVHIEGSVLEKLEGRRITQNKEEFYEFTTKHFSEFALVDTAEVKVDSDDKNDSADKAKSLIKELKLKAVSSKTAKKNVKVTVKMNSKNNTLIKELSDMGYTVKYRYYRSVKKASKYTAVKTKTSKTYINTKGKRGSKYYYKVRAVVYDGDKVIAQSALKQCKYAVRTWSK